MKEQRLLHFKNILDKKMETLLGEALKTVDTMSKEDDNFPDPTDRATLESDRNFELRIRDRERKLLSKIEAALQKIEDGTYGICDECGEQISEKRLEYRPEATLCITCKTKEEEEEKKSRV